jgi:hypothetical protein
MHEARARCRMRTLMAAGTAVVALTVCGVASAAPLPDPARAGSAPVIEPDRRPETVVLTYREVLGEIGHADRGPTLTVFGDGRMVAHYPAYMKRAGDYERRVTPAELDALLGSLAAKGVLEFDAPAVRGAARASLAAAHARARAANAPIELFEASDASTTVIEVHVDRYRPATGAREVRGLAKRVAWTALRTDAQRHPDVPALRDLAAAEQELRALREHPGFAPVR